MPAKIKNFLDKQTEKLVSRKFLVWLASCAFLGGGMLTSEDWVAISLVYIGSQGLIDAALQWKHGSNK
jgi:hypothetical protein